MTTALPATLPATLLAPAVPVASHRAEPDPTGFALAHRALRSGTRLLAQAADGIARDDLCDERRQRRLARFAGAVLVEVRTHFEDAAPCAPAGTAPAGRGEVFRARGQQVVRQAEAALPLFARCASAGAPLLAPVLAELAGLVDEHLAAEEVQVAPFVRVTPADLARCRMRLGIGRLLFLVPWLTDQCHPAELPHALAGADPRTRLLLRAGRRRYTHLRDAVLG